MASTFLPGPPKDAYKFWQDKVPMSKKAFNALAEDDRVKAFVVGGMAKGDMLQAMHDSIGNALATGQSMKAWKKDVRQLFDDKGWNQLQGFRLENIFRTNIQTAYSVGRYRQMMDASESRPYWRYSAINDSRTRASHSALHGRVVRADDSFWDTFYPPNGYRCRCTVTSLSERDLERKGYKVESIEPGQILEIPSGPQKGRAVPVMPDNNFRENPGKQYWKADTSRYRADVKQAVLKDITRACPDDFCGPCEFAETDCFKRLKRHLSKTDLEDLQTVVWADGIRTNTPIKDWIDTALKAPKPGGEFYPLGNLPPQLLSGMKKQPRLAVVAIEDAAVAGMAKEITSAGESVLADKLKALPEYLAAAQWYLDPAGTSEPVALIQMSDSLWIKIRVMADKAIGKSKSMIANRILFEGVTDPGAFEGLERLTAAN